MPPYHLDPTGRFRRRRATDPESIPRLAWTIGLWLLALAVAYSLTP